MSEAHRAAWRRRREREQRCAEQRVKDDAERRERQERRAAAVAERRAAQLSELDKIARRHQWFERRIDGIWRMDTGCEPPLWLLHRYMTANALRLMKASRFEEADVLLELLPRKTAYALLRSFFPDDFQEVVAPMVCSHAQQKGPADDAASP